MYFVFLWQILSRCETPYVNIYRTNVRRCAERCIKKEGEPECSAEAQIGTEKTAKGDQHRADSAAEQGDAAAQYNLGLKYAAGRGVPQDDGKAVGGSTLCTSCRYTRH